MSIPNFRPVRQCSLSPLSLDKWEIVALLLEHDSVDVNSKDRDDRSVLLFAAMSRW